MPIKITRMQKNRFGKIQKQELFDGKYLLEQQFKIITNWIAHNLVWAKKYLQQMEFSISLLRR